MTTTERLSPAAIAALYAEHADELRAFLLGVLRDGDLAGEALQATFAKAAESGHTAREETLKGWLFRVALNEALLLKRRRKLHQRSLRHLASRRSPPAAGNDSPGDAVLRWEVAARVRQALDGIPEEQRRVVRMRIYEEKTFAAIAEELALPLGTVLTRMRLALRKLEAALHDLDETTG